MPSYPSAATRRFLLSSLLLALFSGALYLPGLPGEFLFDDYPNIVNNESVHLKELSADSLISVVAMPQLSGQTRGLPALTFALDYWRGGGADPSTFKTTNILIHALTTFALAWLFRSLLLTIGHSEVRARWLALALALAWAAHPLQVSSVLYVVQRLQTMGTLFLVLALVAYLQARRAHIAGRSGRTGLLGAGLLWAVAMSCKEDSALFPAYTLVLELTVLRFAAADAELASRLRRSYVFATLAGVLLYLFVVIPYYWSWDAYNGRDFSTIERLLTEARVVSMYLWQIVLPLPSHMPFFYDWVQPSRGLLRPWTTLAAIALLLALLVTAWRLRLRQPLFSLGVLLFFSAHFLTSNVVGLELAYEHRNHFALIGAVLAIGSLLAQISQRLQLRATQQVVACGIVLIAVSSATTLRAHSWNNGLRLAQAASGAAPNSARAWATLCASYFEAGGGPTAENRLLDKAISACTNGTAVAPDSLSNPALLIILKTLNGSVSQQDWNLYQHRLEAVIMSVDNQRATDFLRYYTQQGVKLDKQQLLKAHATLARRTQLEPDKNAEIGYFVMNDLNEPDLAMPYFIEAISDSSPLSSFAHRLAGKLREKGRADLAEKIETLGLKRSRSPMQ